MNSRMRFIGPTATMLALLVGCRLPVSKPASESGTVKPTAGVFFDDFDYSSPEDPALTAFRWNVDTKTTLGPKGASFVAKNITFIKDPDAQNNTLMQLKANTSGTGASTFECGLQSAHQRFFEGTYAARVRFFDHPLEGPAVDLINETFYTISTYSKPSDPLYSECDFEYLARGGWDVPSGTTTMFMTTWHTFVPDPWSKDNTYRHLDQSVEGWRLLMVQVMDGQVRYYIDGKLMATHEGKFYPRKNMDIAFNLWFLPEEFCTANTTPRTWIEHVDWTYHACNQSLSTDQVVQEVEKLRSQGVHRLDTVH